MCVCASAGLRGCTAVGTRSATVTPTCASIADEPLRPGVANGERRHDQVQLVRNAGREELGEDLPAPLDH